MNRLLLSALLLFFLYGSAIADEPEKRITTKITDVTVFKQGAQITRTAKIVLLKGKQKLVFHGFDAQFIKESFRFKAKGDLTVLSITHFTAGERKTKENTELKATTDKIEELIRVREKRVIVFEVLDQERDLLKKNKKLSDVNHGVSITELERVSDFYRERMTAINLRLMDQQDKLTVLDEQISALQKKELELNRQAAIPKGETEVLISSVKKTEINVTVQYLVANAGWNPVYDIKAADVQSPLELIYKAQVYQLTAHDWSKVNLTLSTAMPESGEKPELESWILGFEPPSIRKEQTQIMGNGNVSTVTGVITYEQDGMAIPGVTIAVKGFAGIGAIADFDGRYSLEVPQGATQLVYSFVGMRTITKLINNAHMDISMESASVSIDDVVVAAYGVKQNDISLGYAVQSMEGDYNYKKRTKSRKEKQKAQEFVFEEQNLIPTDTRKNTVSTEYRIETPYTIAANGKKYTVEIQSKRITAQYNYSCVPRYNKNAWLVAEIRDWEKLDLLAADANLYFEGSFIGSTRLNPNEVSDTLQISLGKDENIIITRKAGADTELKKAGSNRKRTYDWDIEVRNKRSQAIRMEIKDLIPISANDKVSITIDEQGGAALEAEKGILTWKLDIPAQSSQKVNFKYTVKYPKNFIIPLE